MPGLHSLGLRARLPLLVAMGIFGSACASGAEQPATARTVLQEPIPPTRIASDSTQATTSNPGPRTVPRTVAQQVPATKEPATQVEVRLVATDLDTPWALAFAPDGRLFVTERPGRIRVIEHGDLRAEPLITQPVEETAEGGQMGLALDPNFPDEPYLYTVYTYTGPGGLRNRVVRLAVEGNSAREDRVLLDDLPAANIHNGSRVKFGPDGKLYVTMGDATNPSRAQDPNALAGKLLRINPDGSIPEDNPFPESPVYSLGHRNSQGLDWHPETGQLYATEHGPVGDDEINLIEPGQNYGWPAVQGEEHGPYTEPLAVYAPAIAPAGAAFYDGDAVPQWRGSFFFATLRGQHLHRVRFDPENPRRILEQERLYEGEYGRLRAVALGPDGALYVTTSNRDGRGNPDHRDDRILRIGSVAERSLLYPDLRTLVPDNAVLTSTRVDGQPRHLLRFTTAIWNAGEGPLELREAGENAEAVHQRIYDRQGTFIEALAGRFAQSDGHGHWHFQDFAHYELWTSKAFDAWVSSGRTEGQPEWKTEKVGFCLQDMELHEELPNSPDRAVYPTTCERAIQGLSVGWADIYDIQLEQQWVDLGPEPLEDGEYVLRLIIDPLSQIQESPDSQDAERDGAEANEAVLAITVADGAIISRS